MTRHLTLTKPMQNSTDRAQNCAQTCRMSAARPVSYAACSDTPPCIMVTNKRSSLRTENTRWRTELVGEQRPSDRAP